MARIVAHFVIAGCRERTPLVQIRQYVDDIPQRQEGPLVLLQRHFARAAVDFLQTMTAAGVELSPKSVIVASHAGLARRVQRELAQVGPTLRIVRSARDLGADNTAGQARAVAARTDRRRKAQVKRGRLKRLATGRRPEDIPEEVHHHLLAPASGMGRGHNGHCAHAVAA